GRCNRSLDGAISDNRCGPSDQANSRWRAPRRRLCTAVARWSFVRSPRRRLRVAWHGLQPRRRCPSPDRRGPSGALGLPEAAPHLGTHVTRYVAVGFLGPAAQILCFPCNSVVCHCGASERIVTLSTAGGILSSSVAGHSEVPLSSTLRSL